MGTRSWENPNNPKSYQNWENCAICLCMTCENTDCPSMCSRPYGCSVATKMCGDVVQSGKVTIEDKLEPARKATREAPVTAKERKSRQDELIDMLLEAEGFESLDDLAESALTDSTCPGICTNDGCGYTTEVEPDNDQGYCENCGTQTVKSGLFLAGWM